MPENLPWMGLFLLFAIFALTGCETTRLVSIESTPVGARVYVNDEYKGYTPARFPLTVQEEPHALMLEKEDYAPVESEIVVSDTPDESRVGPVESYYELVRIREERLTQIVSDPMGATIYLGDEVLGTTPSLVKVEFEREDADSEWKPIRLRTEHGFYESTEIELRYEDRLTPMAHLEPLRTQRTFLLRTVDENLDPVESVVLLRGQPVATTPVLLTLSFDRTSSDERWPAVEVGFARDGFNKTNRVWLRHDSPRKNAVVLRDSNEEPVTLAAAKAEEE